MQLTADQIAGAEFLAARPVAYLADVPGLGKTGQFVRALDYVGADTSTIICPPALRTNMQAETDKWSLLGREIRVIASGSDVIPPTGHIAVSYALARRPDVVKRLRKRKPGVLICDEAHALKDREAMQTRAICGASEGLGKWPTHFWWISGTPAPNHAGELYPFLRKAGAWTGGYASFLNKYCNVAVNAAGREVVSTKDVEGVRALLAPIMTRRTEVVGRPPMSEDVAAVDGDGADPFAQLSDAERAAVLEAVESGNYQFGEIPHVATIRRLVGHAKVKGAIDLATTCLEGGHHKLLIFGIHRHVLGEIWQGLSAYGARLILGGCKDLDAIVSEFQDPRSTCRVIVANIQAAGEGLTLTAASRVLIAEPSWTPKDNAQVIARAWRRGQTRPVHASYVCLRNSLDARVTATAQRKARDVSAILD